MCATAVGATVIIPILLAGIKPLERRFIAGHFPGAALSADHGCTLWLHGPLSISLVLAVAQVAFRYRADQ